MNKKFTQSIYGWDETPQGDLVPNWNEQNVIDYIHWQINDNGMSATSVAKRLNKDGYKGKRGGKLEFWKRALNVSRKSLLHERRRKLPNPEKWGSRIWHR